MIGRLPIRWKLTFWNAAFTMLVLVAAGAALSLGLRIALHRSFDEQVMDRGGLAAEAVTFAGSVPTLNRAPAERDDEHEQFVRLVGPDGAVLEDPDRSTGEIPVARDAIARAMQGHRTLSTQSTHEGVMVVVSLPVRNEAGTVVAVLQAGSSRDEVDGFLRTLGIGLMLAIPAILLVAAGGGYLLAGRALRPVADITALAATLDGRDLTSRLDLTLPDDELGRLASTFDAMLDRIEAAFAQQQRFTADVAHELRTPLSIMQGQVDLALTRPRSDEDYRRTIREFEDELARVRRLVDTLFRLARADQHGIPVERDDFDLAATVGVIAEQYAAIAQEAGIALETETVPTPVQLDEDLIVQVLVNLVDNALRSTPAGGRVTIGCRPEDTEAIAWVRDTGIGIAPEHLPHVFERFYRVDAGRGRDRGGAGLGLAIVQELVDAHGGTIGLTSAPGAGTTVTFRLPATPAVSAR